MKTDKIIVANLKCGGCEKTIKNKLSSIEGVTKVIVDLDEDSVTIEHEGKTARTVFTNALHDIGYPEATEENGLLLKLKSYASCAVGKFSKN